VATFYIERFGSVKRRTNFFRLGALGERFREQLARAGDAGAQGLGAGR
jgi:hypothetical protein